MSIAIIDYDAGNTGSLKYVLGDCGFESYIAFRPEDLEFATHIILPGVGSFHKAMVVLNERNFVVAIKDAVLKKNLPILGICLGMQVFATKGFEGGETEGLNLIEGEVKLLKHDLIRLPHVGWNEVNLSYNTPLFKNIISGSDFYFLHSYYFNNYSAECVIAESTYGETFTSVIKKNNIVGVQFHPEKSGKLGRQLLKNFALM